MTKLTEEERLRRKATRFWQVKPRNEWNDEERERVRTWENTATVKRLLQVVKVWSGVVESDMLPALRLGKFSPEAARFFGRLLGDVAARFLEAAEEFKREGEHPPAPEVIAARRAEVGRKWQEELDKYAQEAEAEEASIAAMRAEAEAEEEPHD